MNLCFNINICSESVFLDCGTGQHFFEVSTVLLPQLCTSSLNPDEFLSLQDKYPAQFLNYYVLMSYN